MKYANNPFNIRATKSKWIGQSGSKDGFCTFYSLTYGVRAALYLIHRTYWIRRWHTIRQIIYHWAPPEDNNRTDEYIIFVVNFMRDYGYNVSDAAIPHFFDRQKLLVFLNAMAKIETGSEISEATLDKAFKILYNQNG